MARAIVQENPLIWLIAGYEKNRIAIWAAGIPHTHIRAERLNAPAAALLVSIHQRCANEIAIEIPACNHAVIALNAEEQADLIIQPRLQHVGLRGTIMRQI